MWKESQNVLQSGVLSKKEALDYGKSGSMVNGRTAPFLSWKRLITRHPVRCRREIVSTQLSSGLCRDRIVSAYLLTTSFYKTFWTLLQNAASCWYQRQYFLKSLEMVLNIFLRILFVFHLARGKCLLREPPDIVTPPQQNDAGFFLDISGSPKIYEPGHLYTVSLRVRAFN